MKKNTSLLHRFGPGVIKATIPVTGLCLLAAQTALADLTHRYSFATDATDSIAGANGTIHGGVAIASGTATFPASVPSGDGTDYIELPPGLISNYTSVSFEFWINPGANGTWPEVYGFGNQNAAGQGANMVMFCPHSGPGDFRVSYAQADPGFNDEHVATGGGVLDNLGPCSITCVYDPPNNALSLFRNGLFVSRLSPVTTGAKGFSLTNVYNIHSWLGRSLYNGDAAYNGTLDEFRIYDQPLSMLQIAIDNFAGPDEIVTNFTVTSGTLNVVTNMLLGERQDSTMNLSFTYNGSKPGTVTVRNFSDATYSSQDSNIVSVTTSGRLFATGVGTTTVQAVYGGQTFTTSVIVSGTPNLIHRYSFASDANDSIGGANGTLQGGATVSGGQLVLSGTGSSGSPGDYLDLPNNLFTNLTCMTLEVWATDTGSRTWARIWDFGNSAGGEDTSTGGGDNLFLTQPGGGNILRAELNNGSGAQQVNIDPLPVGKESHVVWINDAAHHTSYLYVNGALRGQNTNTTLTPADLGPTLNDWLGRSQYNDPMFAGSINEFRIWQGQLTAMQVALNAASGPDTFGPSDPGALQAIHLSLNGTMIKGGSQGVSLFADFANITNVNALSLGATYLSADTNIATVSANGLITAVAVGTTTISATYGGKTDSKPVTVVVKPTVLTHRWSFSETSGTSVADSIGTATGTLSAGGATLGGGAVTLDGLAGYVDLPGHLIDGYDAVTFEAWATVNSATLNDDNARLFEFGSTDVVNELGLAARDAGNNTEIRAIGPVSSTVVRGGHLGIDKELQIVAVYNPPAGTVDLFLNGVWQNSVTNLSFSLTGITNLASRLGANLAGADFTAAALNEFRIYNGALDLYGIRTSLAAGPDTVVTNPGTPTSISLRIDSMMVQGERQVPHARASFAAITNADLSQTAEVTYSSSDAGVVSVPTEGLLQAVAPGSATITVSLSGKTDSQPVTVFSKQTVLLHRYSFTNDASDSVGAQDGGLFGTAQVGGGALLLDGDGANKNSYVYLPSRMISSFDAVTLECWVSLGTTLGTWCRVYDFGSQNSGGNGVNYIFCSPHTGTPSMRTVLSDGAEATVDLGNGSQLDGFAGQIAVVYDTVNNVQFLYTNGVQAGSGPLLGKLLTSVNDLDCWIGKSVWVADAGLSGSIDEFRIYAGALTPQQVAADNTAGPDKVVLAPPVSGGPKLTASVSGGNIVVSWPASAAGFVLQSSAAVGSAASWSTVATAPVVVNGFNQVTIPLTGQAAFYRLIK